MKILIPWLFFVCFFVAEGQRAYSYGYVYFDTPGCLSDATPSYVQAFLETFCFGDGMFPPRRTSSNSSGVLFEYFNLTSSCDGAITHTAFFPYNECTNQPFDEIPNDLGGVDTLFFMAIEGGVTEFPPLPLEVTPEILDPIPGNPSVVALFYEPNCPGLPTSLLYSATERCISIFSLNQVEPSVSGTCQNLGDGNVALSLDLYDRSDSSCLDDPFNSLDIPVNICIPFGGNSSTIYQCFFPEEDMTSSEADQTLAITLGVVLPSICLLVSCAICFFFISRFPKRDESNAALRIQGVPLLDDVQIGEVIGSGAFGQVYKGRWNNIEVALKSTKGEDLKEFQNELQIMLEMRHPNILQLFGLFVSKFSDQQPMIVTEFMNRGDLLHLIQTEADITTNQLVEFCRQISFGMEYLHSRNILHRDLACRNILVSGAVQEDNSNLILKVADFGLSRQTEDYYQTNSKKIPIRWTAPEVIEFGKATKASDVWSYGVVVWEIFSRASIPYAGYTNQQVIKIVKKGTRLVSPYGTPASLEKVMQECWRMETDQRPGFSEISKNLKEIDLSKDVVPSRREIISASQTDPLQSKGEETAELYFSLHPKSSQSGNPLEESDTQSTPQIQSLLLDLKEKILKLEKENEHLRQDNKRIPLLETQVKNLQDQIETLEKHE